MTPSPEFSQLLKIMAQLRDKEDGCPWDIEQTFDSIKGYTIEEAYEVADAIERKDYEDLCSELGDLMLQPVFHAQMASEMGLFSIDDVIRSINEKLIRRHPHIFLDSNQNSADGVKNQWDQIKAQEREARAKKRGTINDLSILDDIPRALPALSRAEKLQRRAAKVGFDWEKAEQVLEKCQEELDEVREAFAQKNQDNIKEEIGDLLFVIANLARKSGLEPEVALEDANAKFKRRFEYVEQRCAQDNRDIRATELDILEDYWNEIRAADKAAKPE